MRHRAGQYGRTSSGILPGQKGYGQKESERLAEETRQMEHKLLALRRTMEESKAAAPRGSGGGWKSAAPERGALRNYTESIRQRREGKSRRRKKKGKAVVQHNFTAWSAYEVGCWLRAIGLERHVQTFEANEITGSVLLDVGLDDLDYMKIEVLGHRKIIMREIEKLRRGKSTVELQKSSPQQQQKMEKSRSQRQHQYPGAPTSASPQLPSNGGTGPHSLSPGLSPSPPRHRRKDVDGDYSSSSLQRGRSTIASTAASIQSSSPKMKVHWSQAPRLSDNSVTSTENALPVNLADGTYDEKAQQESFQEAVAAWRRGSGALSSSSAAGGQGPDGAAGAGTGGMWVNPFADAEPGGKLLQGALDEAAEHEQFRKAVEDWRRSGSNEPAANTVSKTSTTTTVASSASGASSAAAASSATAAATGDLDVELEQRRFQSAVEAWRTGGNSEGEALQRVADQLGDKMQEQHEQRRIKLQREKERLQREMRERQEELGRRRREAEEALYASKVEEPSQRVKEYKPKSYAGIWDTEIEF